MEMDEALAAWMEVERLELERGGRPAAPPPTAFTKPSPLSARIDADLEEASKALFDGDFNRKLSCETRIWSPPPRRGRDMLTEEQTRLIGKLRRAVAKGIRTPKTDRLFDELFQMDMRGEGADFLTVRELVFIKESSS